MAKLLILLLLMLAGFLALGIWLYNTFGLWGFVGALAVFAVGCYSLKFLFFWGMQRLFLLPFKAKGKVMKDAALEVHGVTAAEAPAVESYKQIESQREREEEEDGEEEEPDGAPSGVENGNPYRAKGAPTTAIEDEDEYGDADESYDDSDDEEDAPQDWYIVEATITPRPPEGAFRMWEPGELVLVAPHVKRNDLEGEDVGSVADLEIWTDGQWHNDEGYKYEGPQRLKMRVGVRRGTRKARFKYYFEVFGDEITFPAPIDV